MKRPGEKVYFFDLDKIVEATIKTTKHNQKAGWDIAEHPSDAHLHQR